MVWLTEKWNINAFKVISRSTDSCIKEPQRFDVIGVMVLVSTSDTLCTTNLIKLCSRQYDTFYNYDFLRPFLFFLFYFLNNCYLMMQAKTWCLFQNIFTRTVVTPNTDQKVASSSSFSLRGWAFQHGSHVYIFLSCDVLIQNMVFNILQPYLFNIFCSNFNERATKNVMCVILKSSR